MILVLPLYRCATRNRAEVIADRLRERTGCKDYDVLHVEGECVYRVVRVWHSPQNE